MDDLEHRIVELARRNPGEAAALVGEAFGDDLARFLARRLPAAARADVTSEVWLAIVEGIGAFRGVDGEGRPTKVRGWLFGIASNKANDFLRHRHRRDGLEQTLTRLLEQAEPPSAALRDDSSKRPSRLLAAAERRRLAAEQVAELMRGLSPRDRTLLEWRYIDGMMPAQWLDRIEQEGCAAGLGIAEDMAAYLASGAPERARRAALLTNLLTQRVGRAMARLAKSEAPIKRRARGKAGG